MAIDRLVSEARDLAVADGNSFAVRVADRVDGVADGGAFGYF